MPLWFLHNDWYNTCSLIYLKWAFSVSYISLRADATGMVLTPTNYESMSTITRIFYFHPTCVVSNNSSVLCICLFFFPMFIIFIYCPMFIIFIYCMTETCELHILISSILQICLVLKLLQVASWLSCYVFVQQGACWKSFIQSFHQVSSYIQNFHLQV